MLIQILESREWISNQFIINVRKLQKRFWKRTNDCVIQNAKRFQVVRANANRSLIIEIFIMMPTYTQNLFNNIVIDCKHYHQTYYDDVKNIKGKRWKNNTESFSASLHCNRPVILRVLVWWFDIMQKLFESFAKSKLFLSPHGLSCDRVVIVWIQNYETEITL